MTERRERPGRPDRTERPDRAGRRAFSLLAMTVVAPGSAQYVAGSGRRRRIGRIVLRGWVLTLAIMALAFVLGRFAPGTLVSVFAHPAVPGLLATGLTAAALLWAGLFLDTLRLSRPPQLPRRQRLAVCGLTLGLGLATVASLLTFAHYSRVAGDSIAGIFVSDRVAERADNRYNILLLGLDGADDRIGIRPDSITLASIDADTGDTALFGLPRNLQKVPFAPGSPMRTAWPNGFDCGPECLLNAVYTWAADHPAEVGAAADTDPGIAATVAAVEGITGLDVHYHVMVDMGGFRELIDAVGGVTVDVRETVPVGPLDDPYSDMIEAGRREFDGRRALQYARTRVADSDYARMTRQRCVLSSMLGQLDPGTVLRRFEAIAKAGTHVVRTDIPAAELGSLTELAAKARSRAGNVRSVQFVPPMIETADPDFALIRRTVRQAIEPASAGDRAQDGNAAHASDERAASSGSAATGADDREPDGDGSDSREEGGDGSDVTDLGRICSTASGRG